MKKKWMKFTSMLLAAVMVLSMAMTGLAAEIEPMSSTTDTSFTIIINPAYSGETYTAYKIFDVTYNGDESADPTSYSYTIAGDSAWYSTVSNSGLFTLTQIGTSGIYNVVLKDGVTAEQIAAAFTTVPDGAVAAASGSSTFPDKGDGSTGTGSITLDVTASGAGYYFVTTSLGSVVSIDTTNPTATIGDKNTPPVPDKKVDNLESESNENMRTVEYEITAAPINDIVKLVIEDSMSVDEGITYEFNPDSLVVTLYEYEGAEGIELIPITEETPEGDYTFEYNSLDGSALLNDGCDFHVVIREDYDFSIYTSSAYIEVTIRCTIDAHDNQFSDDEVVIPNNARVSYGNNSKSVWDEADIYEYGFEIYKYADENTPLADAEFQISRSTTDGETVTIEYATFYYNTYGEYVLTGWTTDEADESTKITSDSTGYIYVEGLAADEYTLTEIVAPDGYNLLESPITITISVDDDDPKDFTVIYNGTSAEDHIVRVLNNSGTILPGTGGMGTTLFYIVGIVLMVGAAAFFVARKRISKEG